jgi:hypothetical protein
VTPENGQELVERLCAIAPSGWKRIFLNYELAEGQTQYVGSDIAFAVVKKMIGGTVRVDIDLAGDGDIYSMLSKIGRGLMAERGVKGVTIDVIVRSVTDHDWHLDFSPPPRVSATIRGDLMAEFRDPSLKRRYLRYAEADEWIAKIS